MTKQLLQQTLGWGFLLWFIGYLLGLLLFIFVPPSLLGWIITPVGIALTLFVLLTKIKSRSFTYFLFLAVVWTLIAVIFDFLFIVKLFKPADGYYKLDVYLYYLLTFTLPLIVGWNLRKKVNS